MSRTLRVRFAPSPTGFLHVGGARTALFNWLVARRLGGAFVLRIEDTDRERSTDAMTEAILDGLRWLGLGWDEGPVFQSDGIERHRRDAAAIVARNRAYRCFCSSEELDRRRAEVEQAGETYRYDRRCAAIPPDEADLRAGTEAHVVRMRVPAGATEWNDAVHGATRVENGELDDFVVLRTDGTPTYNLAVVSDDIQMGITEVIRGDDHLSNTPKQIVIYQALGHEPPRFAHLPMILGADGKRLSKRHGATSVGEYQSQGILPEALNNFLALLGWSPGDDQEMFATAELVERFRLERVNRNAAVFDPVKLEWMNGQHLMRSSAERLMDVVGPELVAAGLTTPADLRRRPEWYLTLLDLLKPRARSTQEIVRQAAIYLRSAVDEWDPAGVAKHWRPADEVAERLAAVRERLASLSAWEPAELEATLRQAAESDGIAFGKVVHPLRLALTGGTASPGIDQVLALLGREVALGRLRDAEHQLRSAEIGAGAAEP